MRHCPIEWRMRRFWRRRNRGNRLNEPNEPTISWFIGGANESHNSAGDCLWQQCGDWWEALGRRSNWFGVLPSHVVPLLLCFGAGQLPSLTRLAAMVPTGRQWSGLSELTKVDLIFHWMVVPKIYTRQRRWVTVIGQIIGKIFPRHRRWLLIVISLEHPTLGGGQSPFGDDFLTIRSNHRATPAVVDMCRGLKGCQRTVAATIPPYLNGCLADAGVTQS